MKKTTRNKLCGVAVSALAFVTAGVCLFGTNALADNTNGSSSESTAKTETSVIPRVDELFTTSGAALETNVNLPSYFKAGGNGLKVTASEGATIEYENEIDLRNATREDLLFEVAVTPSNSGTREFKQLEVVLTDTENPKSYISISIHSYDWDDSSKGRLTHITAKTNTINEYTGWFYEAKESSAEGEQQAHKMSRYMRSGVKQGTIVGGSFKDAGSSTNELYAYNQSIKLWYDAEENALYASNQSSLAWASETLTNKEEFVDENNRVQVIDFDNPTCMGTAKSNLWSGFQGKAKMTVKVNTLEANSANFVLLTVDGQKLNNVYLDDVTAPQLTVDVPQTISDAVAGRKYSFFDAAATDKMFGVLDDLDVSVYYGDKKILTSADGFVPVSAGEYVLTYTATDPCGNKAVQNVSVTAKNAADVSPLTATINETSLQSGAFDLRAEQAEGGYYAIPLYGSVILPTFDVSGGVGNYSTEVQVSFSGGSVDVQDGVFFARNNGVYKVLYIFTDYVGNRLEQAYYLASSYNAVPEIDKPYMQTEYCSGETYLLPAVSAKYYTEIGENKEYEKKIIVWKEDGKTKITEFDGSEAVAFTPDIQNGAKQIVEYRANASGAAEYDSYSTEITVREVKGLADRFIAENGATVNVQSMYTELTYEQSGQSVWFVNAIPVEGAAITFSVNKEENALDRFVITLTDSADQSKKLTLSVYKHSDPEYSKSEVSVDGGKRYEVSADFYGNNMADFKFYFYKNGEVRDFNGDLCGAAENFAGFTSGKVFVEFSAEGVTGKSTIKMKYIRNHLLGEVESEKGEDYMKPVVITESTPASSELIGKTITVPAALAGDVYSVKTSLKVTVTDPSGNVLLSSQDEFGRFDGANVTLNQYGSYKIEYVAIDGQGNKMTKRYSVSVSDRSVPQIIYEDEYFKKTMKVGETITLPAYSATDNVTEDLVKRTYLFGSNGKMYVATNNKFTPTVKGTYRVVFYVEDEAGNYSQKEVGVIIVK